MTWRSLVSLMLDSFRNVMWKTGGMDFIPSTNDDRYDITAQQLLLY